jgi:hypothetical protein
MFLKGGKDRVFNGQKPWQQTFFNEVIKGGMIELFID